jgi:transposase-like protein
VSNDPFFGKTEDGSGESDLVAAYLAYTEMGRGRGRPSKIYDVELRAEVVDNIRAGTTIEVAATAAGIAPRTFYNWKRRAEVEALRQAQGLEPNPEEVPYVHFLQELLEAEAQAEAGMVAEIRAEKGGAWRILTRRFPERWAPTSRKEVDIRIQHARATLDSLPAELRELVEERLMARVHGGRDSDPQVIEG